ncbi:hypothetical protein U9M48_013676 [Paspalum notatum var. saurae]|uniref:ABC transporter domain-containing protein n=1 Tax=Paspalum notatum var. saurae TaxID=547442 RepID=A0AAQ3SZY2_PASNO
MKARRGGRAILGAGTGKEERGVGPRPRRSSSAGSSPSGVGQKRKEGGEVGDGRRGPPSSERERRAAACWAFLAGGPRVAAGPVRRLGRGKGRGEAGRLGCEAPEKVEIVFDGVSVEAVVPVGRQAMPTLPNAIINGGKAIVDSVLMCRSRKKTLKIIDGVSGTIRSHPGNQTWKRKQPKTNYIIKILGLSDCADTIVGDELHRGISGGQKKRTTIGEMLVGRARCFFMDDVSTGLDSSTTLQIMTFLQQMAHLMDLTMVISLLQPAPETFEIFDDIILLCEGQIVYHGPRENVTGFFNAIGFRCPSRKNIADFLQEVGP